jgi:CRISPR/Cas system endoribonuclease Cas6 (RAMP superfamily)
MEIFVADAHAEERVGEKNSMGFGMVEVNQ